MDSIFEVLRFGGLEVWIEFGEVFQAVARSCTSFPVHQRRVMCIISRIGFIWLCGLNDYEATWIPATASEPTVLLILVRYIPSIRFEGWYAPKCVVVSGMYHQPTW